MYHHYDTLKCDGSQKVKFGGNSSKQKASGNSQEVKSCDSFQRWSFHMRPDQRWFPTSRAESVAWFHNFATVFSDIGASLGFSQAEIDSVNADNAIVKASANAIASVKAFERAVIAFERVALSGKSTGLTPNFPVFPDLAMPPMVPAGVFERLERLVRRIRLAHGYNEEVGVQLGIIPSRPRTPDLGENIPKFEISTSGDGYAFSVKAAKRGFTGFRVEYRRNSSDVWESSTTFTRSPAKINVIPSTPGDPELLHVRIRMVKGNDPVGKYSDEQTVVILP